MRLSWLLGILIFFVDSERFVLGFSIGEWGVGWPLDMRLRSALGFLGWLGAVWEKRFWGVSLGNVEEGGVHEGGAGRVYGWCGLWARYVDGLIKGEDGF